MIKTALIVISFLLAPVLAHAHKDAMKEPSKEERVQMADSLTKMADCLKGEKPAADCHKEMMAACPMAKKGACPMMAMGHEHGEGKGCGGGGECGCKKGKGKGKDKG
jgi:hypothetical protein